MTHLTRETMLRLADPVTALRARITDHTPAQPLEADELEALRYVADEKVRLDIDLRLAAIGA